jgi:hypothetical protein
MLKWNKDHQLVYSFFRQHSLVTVTTVSAEGIPQNAAMYTYMDDMMRCYLASRVGTRKYNNITQNGVVVISAYDEISLTFSEILCHATVIEDPAEVARILPELQTIVASRSSSYWVPPVAQLEGNQFVFFRCTPKEATIAEYDDRGVAKEPPHVVTFEL